MSSRRLFFHAVAASVLAALALPPIVGMGLDLASFLPIVALAAVPLIFWPYVTWRRMDPAKAGIETAAASLLLIFPLLVFTYAAMRLNMPLADARLAAMDAAIGFNAPDFVRLVDRSAILSTFLAICYSSFSVQLIFLPILLCATGLGKRAHAMLFGFIVIGVFSSVVCIFFPSVGALAYFGLEKTDLAHVNGKFGYFFLKSFEAVRSNPHFTLTLDAASGIVTFPSVHAAVAVLCAWAAWEQRWLRWPLLALNIGMFVSALSHGAHYLVDLIAGAFVALAAITLTRKLFGIGAPAATTLNPVRAAPAAAALAR